MGLEEAAWTQRTVHFMHLQWLKGERQAALDVGVASQLIDQPKLEDPLENYRRHRGLMLAGGRLAILVEIPPDTVWYEVEHLTEQNLDDLHVIGRVNWDSKKGSDLNELRKVIGRINADPLRLQPRDWVMPILWGHEKKGPFTILEGNHRFTSYGALVDPPELKIPVCVGLSPSLCFWHLPDQVWRPASKRYFLQRYVAAELQGLRPHKELVSSLGLGVDPGDSGSVGLDVHPLAVRCTPGLASPRARATP
jgi:hypothetical protein